jgi:heme exporter protein D
MIASIRQLVGFAWNFIFNHEVSPLRNIPDVAVRHYVLQLLGFMWAVSFSVALGSYTFFAWSVLGHTVLIAAAAITVATLTTASRTPLAFIRSTGRRRDGEHE